MLHIRFILNNKLFFIYNYKYNTYIRNKIIISYLIYQNESLNYNFFKNNCLEYNDFEYFLINLNNYVN